MMFRSWGVPDVVGCIGWPDVAYLQSHPCKTRSQEEFSSNYGKERTKSDAVGGLLEGGLLMVIFLHLQLCAGVLLFVPHH